MEYFDIINEKGEVVGKALRSECHGNPALVHRAAHVLVFNKKGKLLLQLRSKDKDIQPGKWDTSVGGHLGVGESYEQAALREMKEELGVDPPELEHLYDYPMRNEIESENIRSFMTRHEGPFKPQAEEIDEIKFWSLEEIASSIDTGVFTPNFETEFRMLALFFKKSEDKSLH